MESSRCKTFVRNEMNKLGIHDMTVELGKIEIMGELSEKKLQMFDAALRNAGLELIRDKKMQHIEKIKAAIYELVYLEDDLPKPNNSDYISKKVSLSYTYINTVFSEMLGTTIEKYIIEQRIERVKELLAYTELSLTDMAFKLHFSSVAHLSSQFKKLTGVNPSFYQKLRNRGKVKP
ncbi:helix-turn-helix domain-containing protein [Prolixibacter bellariivorans]|nr:AraC family transcriptional regulator [Prolixibacter bellariivorans]